MLVESDLRLQYSMRMTIAALSGRTDSSGLTSWPIHPKSYVITTFGCVSSLHQLSYISNLSHCPAVYEVLVKWATNHRRQDRYKYHKARTEHKEIGKRSQEMNKTGQQMT